MGGTKAAFSPSYLANALIDIIVCIASYSTPQLLSNTLVRGWSTICYYIRFFELILFYIIIRNYFVALSGTKIISVVCILKIVYKHNVLTWKSELYFACSPYFTISIAIKRQVPTWFMCCLLLLLMLINWGAGNMMIGFVTFIEQHK